MNVGSMVGQSQVPPFDLESAADRCVLLGSILEFRLLRLQIFDKAETQFPQEEVSRHKRRSYATANGRSPLGPTRPLGRKTLAMNGHASPSVKQLFEECNEFHFGGNHVNELLGSREALDINS
ncbi:hypothetical protein AVEN_106922-1 [Araneus ventricosus]|uniref:Uncharacterized protein n=1 Tax=Araneus ventricosus TaxID=182803 RepID=A0A4Y2NT75_ARAVE|nr:hypothetical protein AVEN_106922-1 [Araneus ventricosus]